MALSQHFLWNGMEQNRKYQRAPHTEEPIIVLGTTNISYCGSWLKKYISEYCPPQCLHSVIASLSQSHFASL